VSHRLRAWMARVGGDGTAARLGPMPAAPLLTEEEISSALAEMPDWELVEGRLVRRFRWPDFRTALEFVNRLAPVADEQDHHPDVAIHWGELELSLWTHAVGGITRRDLRLAREIDRLAGSR
jgi:4a-hydroxytetrahydrobiopterin dehydratase